MHPCTHVRMQHAAVARAAPVLLPRCPGSSKCQHRHGIARAANTSAQTAVEQRTAADQVQEQQQQVPVHIARRLAALQEEVQQAYESGYKAGYTAGVKVQVNVGVDMSSSRQQQQLTQRQQPTAASGSSTTNNSSSSSSGQSSEAAAADSLARSAVKGLVWRLFSTTATMGIALLVLHDVLQVEDALKLGALEFTVKFMLYFMHERLWATVKFL